MARLTAMVFAYDELAIWKLRHTIVQVGTNWTSAVQFDPFRT